MTRPCGLPSPEEARIAADAALRGIGTSPFSTRSKAGAVAARDARTLPNPFAGPEAAPAPSGTARLLASLGDLLRKPVAGRRVLAGIAMYGHVASPGTALLSAFRNEEGLGRTIEASSRTLLQGGTVAEAAERSGLFDPTVVTLLSAGERSRRFGAAVESALAHVEAKGRNLRFVATAFVVLWLELLVALASVGWLAIYGFPQIRQTMTAVPGSPELVGALVRAEWANTALLATAFIVFTGAGLATAAAVFGKSAAPIARLVNLLPGLKPLLESAGLATSCEVASSILKAGLGFHRACEAAAASTVVVSVRLYWNTVMERALAGESCGQAVARPPLQAGERSLVKSSRNARHLADVLDAVGKARGARARTQMQLLASAGAALLLGFIVLSGLNLLQAYSVQMQSRDSVLDRMGDNW